MQILPLMDIVYLYISYHNNTNTAYTQEHNHSNCNANDDILQFINTGRILFSREFPYFSCRVCRVVATNFYIALHIIVVYSYLIH